MWAEIDAKFHIADEPVIFAWGDTIFNPSVIAVTPSLLSHEAVHGRRQGQDVEGWWHRYIDDDQFRFDEEVLAHRAEYWRLVRGFSFEGRRLALDAIVEKMLAPIYAYPKEIASRENARRAMFAA